MNKKTCMVLFALFLWQSSSVNVNAQCNHKKITIDTDIRQITTIDNEKFRSALKGNLKEESNSFLEYGFANNINPIILASISAHESGWGTSNLSLTKNNIFGISHSTKKWSIFNSKSSCIKWTAEMLNEDYINKGYVTLRVISKFYCPDGSNKWAKNIASIANSITHEIECK